MPVLFRISNGCIGFIFPTFGTLPLTRLGTLFGGNQGPVMPIAAILFTVGSLAIGYLPGGSSKETRNVLAVGTGFRHISAALVVITATFQDPGNDVLILVLIVTLVGVIIVSAIVGLTLKESIDRGKSIGYSAEQRSYSEDSVPLPYKLPTRGSDGITIKYPGRVPQIEVPACPR